MPNNYYLTPDDYKQAEKNGITYKQLYRRVYIENWNKDRAINTPMRKVNDRKKWLKVARQNGIKDNAFYMRVNALGWTEQRAATTKTKSTKEITETARSKRGRKIPKKYLKQAKENGIKEATFYTRVYRYGWSYEDASTIDPRRNTNGMRNIINAEIKERESNVHTVR